MSADPVPGDSAQNGQGNGTSEEEKVSKDTGNRKTCNFYFVQKDDITIVQEGKARVAFHGPVFYNPVQEFNRDLTVLVLRQFVADREKASAEIQNATNGTGDEEPATKRRKVAENDQSGNIRILDALSASGLRALRFSQEVPNVDFILANDFSENAVESIKCNIDLNGVQDKVRANFGDAIMTMMQHRSLEKRFHAVDLDPYGTASNFLDSGVQCVAENGILMVTCTDMAVLCGNTPEACYTKYGAVTTRTKCCHEMALRILLRAIDTQANRYARYIEPLLSVSVDFYVRVFVRVKTGAREAKDSGIKVGNVLVCSGCHSMEIAPILRKHVDGKSVKYLPYIIKHTLLDGNNKCVHCSHPVHHIGPIYTAPIHDKVFVQSLLQQLKATQEEERLGTHNRLLGVLTTVHEELDDVPLYYEAGQMMNICKSPMPKLINVRSAILNAGFRVSGSHCCPKGIKTDATLDFLWDVIRYQAQSANVRRERLHETSPGFTILGKEIKYLILKKYF
ncbi:hypothetical protein WR25_17696 isoform B [Diploscapter pachys]|uniref:tRNA (guanine(26)-N(2))-dimethyltransferase n=1 Tax=Diploscapter pachys TaxID=2018661 RepID=A0A2A2KMN9_9BILA|nr:hypothetical protein WR25_17696 isoform B [Diploscapter pachys]